MGFGTYFKVPLAQARKNHDQAKALLAQEVDPKEQKDDQLREKQLAAGNTFESVVTDGLLLKNKNSRNYR